jgi:O-antigen ligase
LLQKGSTIVDRYSRSFVVLYLLFLGWCGLSLIWTPNHKYATTKFIHLSILVTWSLVAGWAIIGVDNSRIRRFLVAVAGISAWVAVEIMILVVQDKNIRTLEWSRHYLGLGRLVGLGMVIVAGYLTLSRWEARKSIVLVGLLGIYTSVLLVAGGRGPLLATAASLLVLMRTSTRIYGGKLRVGKSWALSTGIFAVIAICLAVFLASTYDLMTIVRIQEIFEHGGGGSAQTRLWLYRHAVDGWLQSPIAGAGLGGFGSILRWGDGRVYPHNMVLEILVELGVVGFVLFALMTIPILVRAYGQLATANWRHIVLFMMVANALLNAMVTGDLTDNRVFFGLIGVLAASMAKCAGARNLHNEIPESGVRTPI